MNPYIRAGMAGILLVSLILWCGISFGDIPPISVQNAHTTISADFSADILEGPAPLTVTFTDLSTGISDHYEWSFGDGETSAEKNPVHIFTEPGVYTISLSVSGTGGSDKKTRIGYLTVLTSEQDMKENQIPSPSQDESEVTAIQNGELSIPEPEPTPSVSPSSDLQENSSEAAVETISSPEQSEPALPIKADFTLSEQSGLAPLKVTFTDQSIGMIQSWNWNFGDGTSSAAVSPIHIYQNPGIYDITLTITGEGSSDTITKSQVVQVIEPVKAGFIAEPFEGVVPLDVSFIEQNNGTVIKRNWNFGDGLQSDIENPVHKYESPGTYEVSLLVSGSHNEDILTRPAYIVVHPDLPPSPTVPTEIPSPEITQVADPNYSEQPVSTPEPVKNPVESENPDETIPDEINTNTPTLTAGFQMTPETGYAPLSVNFNDISTGSINAWLWQFGDGQSSNEQNPVHLFESAGTYPVNLTIYGVGNENGVSLIKEIAIISAPDTPKAEFIVSSQEGPAPLPIVCTDQSSGEINEWIWDFGDGKIIRGKNPTHTYSQPGTYSITLRVKGPGGKDEIRKDGFITVSTPPASLNAEFSATNTKGNIPLEVSFTDQSSGVISSWIWDFGDGTTSTDQNPVHEYTKAGVYSVKLGISGPDGTSEKVQENLITAIYNPAPIQSAFSALPITGESPLSVTFKDQTIGDTASWKWDFGDGITSDQKDPVHTYLNPGIYSVTLHTDGPGGQDTVAKENYISVLGSTISPEIIITADPTEGTAPLTVNFNKSSANNEIGFFWEFGDGTTSQESNPAHTFLDPALYNISLTIQDNAGNNRTITKNEFINVTKPTPPPHAQYSCNISEGVAPCIVRFTDRSQGEITEWLWEFGDGITETSQDVTHTFISPGEYPVQLTVTGPGGVNTSSDVTMFIREPESIKSENLVNANISPDNLSDLQIIYPANQSDNSSVEKETGVNTSSNPLVDLKAQQPVIPLVIQNETDNESIKDNQSSEIEHQELVELFDNEQIPSISPSITNGPAPFTVRFTSSWDDEPGSYLWDFGDDITSEDMNPEHTYQQPGTYSVHLIRESETGMQEIIQNDLIQVTEPVTIPVASFKVDPVSGPAPLNVSFESTSSGTITDWDWDFGDESEGHGENLIHSYTRPGTYTVSLTVMGEGGSSEEVRENLITVSSPKTPPQAKFRTDKRTGYAPLEVSFTDQSLGKVTEWNWDFGDESFSSEKNPRHTFVKPGIYTVGLTVSGPTGTHAVSRKGYIVVSEQPEPLVAKFTLTPATGDAPLLVQCSDASTGTINRYLWEFGDGAVSENQNPSHQYTSPGSYTVKLTIYGKTGISSADQTILVGPTLTKPTLIHGRLYNVYPSEEVFKEKNNTGLNASENGPEKSDADFTIKPKTGKAPLNVTFSDNSSGFIETWVWDFGDGETSSKQNPVHQYTSPGNYTVILTINGPEGVSTKKLLDGITIQ